MRRLAETLLLAVATACVSAPGARAQTDLPFGRASLWDDGRAELSQYTGTTLRYGEERPTEARIVIVKEDLLSDALVKSDAGPIRGRTFEALKMIAVDRFTTGTYDYHRATTLFFDRGSMALRKQTMSSWDGCGTTFVRLGPVGGRWMHDTHSYWEGEGDRAVAVEWPAAARDRLTWDALPLWLRGALMDGGPPQRVWLLPSQVAGRSPADASRPVEAVLKVRDAGRVSVPAGTFEARLVEVTLGRDTDRLWFDAAAPHVMLRMETASGRRLVLRKTQRLAYWEHQKNGDEALLR
jgi:hypothetical protein